MSYGMMPDRPQYHVFFNHPEAPAMYSVRLSTATRPIGRQLAAHKNLEAVRQRIPPTHEKAPFAQVAPLVEVWVLKEGVTLTNAEPPKTKGERYPRGWHPDDEGHG